MLTEPFDGARGLLNRAGKHIFDLDIAISNFKRDCNDTVITEPDIEVPGAILMKVRFAIDFPDEIPLIVFDALNCLRSALDHAVYDASRALTNVKSPKNTKFPFGPDLPSAIADLDKKRSEVPEEIRPFLLKFQPYLQAGDPVLWAMNDLRNRNIHRMLSPMAQNSGGLAFKGGFIGSMEIDPLARWDAKKREITLMRIHHIRDTNIEMDPLIDVAFEECAPIKKMPALGVLRDMRGKVKSIIDGIEAETQRLLAVPKA